MSNDYALGLWVKVIIVQVLGKYMVLGYLDPQGLVSACEGMCQDGKKLEWFPITFPDSHHS